ncbi:MAG: START domain-containing protein [Myxococcota bacterium]
MSAWLALMGLLAADPGWKQSGRADGVTSWVRDDPQGGVPSLRGEVEIEAALFDVLGVLHDVDQSCAWTPDCREARRIKDLSRFSSLIYLRTKCPWPVQDRDAVIETAVEIKPDGRAARASFRAVELPEVPPVAGVVRMRVSDGSYYLAALGPQKTRVRYELRSDPGGSVPTGVARKVLEQLPHDALLALKRRAESQRGAYAAFQAEYDPTLKR